MMPGRKGGAREKATSDHVHSEQSGVREVAARHNTNLLQGGKGVDEDKWQGKGRSRREREHKHRRVDDVCAKQTKSGTCSLLRTGIWFDDERGICATVQL